jgi:N-methylhydantoinase A/oxoprolinase/acetone carboxylase beta subunit
MTPIYLGIDTGGTFTDGVLLDPLTHTILKTTKVLTTHHDLRICIAQVLDQLASDGGGDISLVSLSTTLATNAIAEGKARPVALFLLGYDQKLVYQYDFHTQFGTDRFFFIDGGMDMNGREQSPLDEETLAARVSEVMEQVEAFAVSSYAGTFNASHEERAGTILSHISGLPVVQGNHLTSRLNSIRRATTASLNAGLLSTAYDFLTTVQAMLVQRSITCPLIVVRGDGSLVSADFASHRPVEIIHSGPATSAIGGLYLAGVESALVIDMGGTTTDLALLSNGRPLLDKGQATVSGYKTSVRTIRARSFGLGGDSQIQFSPRGEVTVGPRRVIPLSYLAYQYPEVKHDLLAWLEGAPEKFYSDRLAYWLLRREPRQPFRDTRTQKVLDLLRGGPKRLPWLLKQAGAVSVVQVDGSRLVREDIIAEAGLTPTDLLHVTGEYAPWDRETACKVVEVLAHSWGCSPDALVEMVREQMTRKIVAEVLHFLTGHEVPDALEGTKNGSLARWMFEENLAPSDPFLGFQVQLKLPVIGIGAPARAFLGGAAAALGTEIIFPQHYAVANAVGTVVGNVFVQHEAEVLPVVEGSVITGYTARAGSHQARFASMDEALVFARTQAAEQARAEAAAAGAKEPVIEMEEENILGGMVRLSVRAVGKPG